METKAEKSTVYFDGSCPLCLADISMAAAFVEIWARLPRWRWAARAASLPGALAALELGYRMFLPIRPLISRLFRILLQHERVDGGANRG